MIDEQNEIDPYIEEDTVISVPPGECYPLVCLTPEAKAALDAEITALRELVLGVREYVAELPCHCDKLSNGDLCGSHAVLGWIDRSLAAIAGKR